MSNSKNTRTRAPQFKGFSWKKRRKIAINARYAGKTLHDSYVKAAILGRFKAQGSSFTVGDYTSELWNNATSATVGGSFNGYTLFIGMKCHVTIARAIVRDIAKGYSYDEVKALKNQGITADSNKKIRADVRQAACYEIVKKGYSEPIFDDICNEIATDLLNMHIDGDCEFYVEDYRIKASFADYTNKKDEVKSSFNKLYNSVGHVLARYSNNNHRNNGKMVVVDNIGLRISDEGDVLGQYSIGKSSPAYVSSTSFLDSYRVVSNTSVYDKFRALVYDTYRLKKALTMLKVFNALVVGMKSEEIARNCGLSIDTVKHYRADIRELYQKNREKLGLVKYHSMTIIENNKTEPVTEIVTYHDSKDCTLDNVTKSDIKTIRKSNVADNGFIPTYEDYKPTVGSIIANDNSYETAENRIYSSDSKVELIKNADNIDVYYTNKIDISADFIETDASNDSKKRINRVYIHSVAIVE